METPPNEQQEQPAPVVNERLRLVALLVTVIGLAIAFYGIWRWLLRPPIVPPPLAPVTSEAPLIVPEQVNETPTLVVAENAAVSAAAAATQPLAEVPVAAVAEPPPAQEPPKPSETTNVAKSQQPKPKRTATRSASRSRETARRSSVSAREPNPPSPQASSVPSAYEQLLMRRAARARAAGKPVTLPSERSTAGNGS
ncbi:hypothetical protein FJZ36_07345 [Candidatus Poribacteria bacterium]|nr:hypothetical protein [Candidatus Poribacteria bacterium]